MRFLNHKSKKFKLLLFSQLIIILWLFSFFPAFAQQIAAGEYHTCVIKNGGVKCWGDNYYGQIGIKDDTINYVLLPTDIEGLDDAQSIIADNNANYVLTNGGGVKYWGGNIFTPTEVSGLNSGVKAIAFGGQHTCALLDSGGVKCWGNNGFGQLGNDNTDNTNTPTQVQGLNSGVKAIASYWDHTCALLEDGSVKCWGKNEYGQLGNGEDGLGNYKETPTDVINLDNRVKAITLGDFHTCALLDSGGVKCWGLNENGELGNGSTANKYTPTDVSGLSSGVKAIVIGDSYTCALLETGGVKCWGTNDQGQLGNGSTNNKRTPTNVIGLNTGVKSISLGINYTCALLESGGVKCWGNNDNGQLGDGSTISKSTPTDVKDLTAGVKSIAVGFQHTCALLDDDRVKCWGDNSSGQLGDGSTIDRSEPIEVNFEGISSNVSPPTVTSAVSEDGRQTTSGLVISRNQVDGEEVTHFKINNIQHGTLFQNDGSTQIKAGDFITIEAGQAGLKFTPNEGVFTPGSGINQGSFEVFAATADNEEGVGEESVTALIDFDLINDPPILEPIGEQAVPVGQLVSFTAQAKDPNLQMQNLTFSLQKAPDGATIHPTTGQFTWIPEKPGVYSATVVVTDDGDQPANLSTMETIEIIATEKPVLAELLPQTVPVNQTLTFTATATHLLGQPLVYSLINNTLPGATLDPNTGEFNWTPSDEGIFYATIQVTDTVTQLTDEQAVLISVSNNTPPELTPIPNQVIPLNHLFTYQVIATDLQENQLFYLLEGERPKGAALHPLNGELTWIPNQVGTYTFTVSVTEMDGIPMNLTARTQFQLSVNTQPSIEDIEEQIINLGNTLTYQVNAIHPSGNPLGYRLMNELPGAEIDPNTGLFTWTPEQAGTYEIQIQAFDKTDETFADTQVITLTANPVKTRLMLELSSNIILRDGSLKVTGHLFREVKTALSPSDLPIVLRISEPDNFWDLSTQTQADGSFEVNDLPALEKGTYQFQAYFKENHAFAKSQSEPQPLTVREVAGYAILIQGRTADDEDGVATYNKTMNRVYLAMKEHGFKDEDIEYLNFNTEQSNIGIEVDAQPSISAIQGAFNKLQPSINAAPAPLFLVMVDHGSSDGTFYIDQGDGARFKAADLSHWLNNLEKGLTPEVLEQQPRVIIIGACYAGTFLPAISKPGRITIVSAAADEESYKGPKEPDETRSGEFFTEAFFSWLARNKSVKKAFELATIATEITTRQEDDDGTAITNRFQDNAAQHPLLDDNGDKIGSNVLSTGFGDGLIAKDIYLGSGLRPEKEMSAHITDITETRYLDATTSVTELFAVVNNANRVKDNQVIVDIRPPSLALASQGVEAKSALEINELIRRVLPASSEPNRFSGHFDVFQKPGKYEVMYFVVDTETGEISPFERSLVYKNRLGNLPPEAFHLQVPKNDSEPETTLIFDWDRALDPDIEPLTYTLLIATDPALQKVVYRQEELTVSMSYLDNNTPIDDLLKDSGLGLRDGTQYYWQVEAIDPYGARATSEVFSFTTNNTNAHPGISTMHVSSALNYSPIDEAQFIFLDEFDNPLTDFNPDWYQDQGQYNMLLPAGRRRAIIKANGFEEQKIKIDTSHGLSLLNITLEPQGGISLNPGQLQFTADNATVDENMDTISVLVKREGSSDGTVSVNYASEDETAMAGDDYLASQGTLTWEDQDNLSKRITIKLKNDTEQERDKTFKVKLDGPTGATLGPIQEISITIVDDDLPGIETPSSENTGNSTGGFGFSGDSDTPSSGDGTTDGLIDDANTPETAPSQLQFATTDYFITEGESAKNFPITRLGNINQQVSVQYAIQGGMRLQKRIIAVAVAV
jgi:alpha-tubulin suppressor-like RCC1 family protein